MGANAYLIKLRLIKDIKNYLDNCETLEEAKNILNVMESKYNVWAKKGSKSQLWQMSDELIDKIHEEVGLILTRDEFYLQLSSFFRKNHPDTPEMKSIQLPKLIQNDLEEDFMRFLAQRFKTKILNQYSLNRLQTPIE